MPTTILLLLLAWSSPHSGMTPPGHRPDPAVSSSCLDDSHGMADACRVHADADQSRWPGRSLAIVEDRDDDERDGEFALLDRPSTSTHRQSARTSGLTAPRPIHHAVDRSPILRC